MSIQLNLKLAWQLFSLISDNPEADQRLCFRYLHSTYPLFSKSKIFISDHRLWLHRPVMSDLVGNPEDRLAHMAIGYIFHKGGQRKPCSDWMDNPVNPC